MAAVKKVSNHLDTSALGAYLRAWVRSAAASEGQLRGRLSDLQGIHQRKASDVLMVAERMVRRVLRAGLKDELGRQEEREEELGPTYEPEERLTRTFLPVGPGWVEREPVELPALSLPDGYIVAGPVVGADEIRAHHLVVAAQAEFGWGRSA